MMGYMGIRAFAGMMGGVLAGGVGGGGVGGGLGEFYSDYFA